MHKSYELSIWIERTRARNIFFRRDTEIGEKVIFWVKRENFSGPVPTESLRTQDSENIVGFGDRAFVNNKGVYNHWPLDQWPLW